MTFLSDSFPSHFFILALPGGWLIKPIIVGPPWLCLWRAPQHFAADSIVGVLSRLNVLSFGNIQRPLISHGTVPRV